MSQIDYSRSGRRSTTAKVAFTSFIRQCALAAPAKSLVRIDDILKSLEKIENGVVYKFEDSVCRLAYLQLVNERVENEERLCINLGKWYQPGKLVEQGIFSSVATNSSSMSILDYQFTDPMLKYYLAAVYLFKHQDIAFDFFTTKLLEQLNKSCWCVLEFYFGLVEPEAATGTIDHRGPVAVFDYLLQRINKYRVIQDSELAGQIFLLILGCVFEAPHLELLRYVEETLQVITFCYPAELVKHNLEIFSYFLSNSSLQYMSFAHRSYAELVSKLKTAPFSKEELPACCTDDEQSLYYHPDTILVTSFNDKRCLQFLLSKGIHEGCKSCCPLSSNIPSQPQMCDSDRSGIRSMPVYTGEISVSSHSLIKSASGNQSCETNHDSKASIVNITHPSIPLELASLCITHSCPSCFRSKELVTLPPRSSDPLNIDSELIVPYSKPCDLKKTTVLVLCASSLLEVCRPSMVSGDRFVSSDLVPSVPPSPNASADDEFVFTTCACRQEDVIDMQST